jgi:hypothetical protein
MIVALRRAAASIAEHGETDVRCETAMRRRAGKWMMEFADFLRAIPVFAIYINRSFRIDAQRAGARGTRGGRCVADARPLRARALVVRKYPGSFAGELVLYQNAQAFALHRVYRMVRTEYQSKPKWKYENGASVIQCAVRRAGRFFNRLAH